MNESGVVSPILKILFINGIIVFSIKNVEIIYIYILFLFFLSIIDKNGMHKYIWNKGIKNQYIERYFVDSIPFIMFIKLKSFIFVVPTINL